MPPVHSSLTLILQQQNYVRSRPGSPDYSTDSGISFTQEAESNDAANAINVKSIDLADLINTNPNVVALASLHASWNTAVLPAPPDKPRSTATTEVPRPNSPDYSSDSDISFTQNVENNGWDAESAPNSHNYENDVDGYAALGPNHLNPQRLLDLAAYWGRRNPGNRPSTPPVSTRAHFDEEIKVNYWFDPALRPWVPIDCDYVRKNTLAITAA